MTAVPPASLAAALADAIDPLAEIRYRRQLCREAYERGRAAGIAEGRAAADADWFASLAPARAGARVAARTPVHAELEKLRWGPGGRDHFGDPRPGDYTGETARQDKAAKRGAA
jgi:hypothetical protein